MGIGRQLKGYLTGRRIEGTGEAGGEAAPSGRPNAPSGELATTVAMLDEERPHLDAAIDDNGRAGEMDEERLQILRMVEERKITAEEAAKLLAALDTQPAGFTEPRTTRARWLRVRVTDKGTGRPKVNVNVPVSAVLALGKLGNRFGGSFLEKEGIDLEGLIEAIRSGAEGKIVDVDDENSRDRVEVFVE